MNSRGTIKDRDVEQVATKESTEKAEGFEVLTEMKISLMVSFV
jgi:hypothetical protein